MTISNRQHLLEARNAYLQGDYPFHMNFLERAKKNGVYIAQQLNLKATIEIFKTMNRTNNIMRMVDLHGLHAKETIQVFG
ncbi:unnamed protein product [Lupinus luteus]|uniref:Uncharacterized protein n=1 Tax=Lupinus luteus TaxID=3873 RepID=A0AAV1WI74_LUPLU